MLTWIYRAEIYRIYWAGIGNVKKIQRLILLHASAQLYADESLFFGSFKDFCFFAENAFERYGVSVNL